MFYILSSWVLGPRCLQAQITGPLPPEAGNARFCVCKTSQSSASSDHRSLHLPLQLYHPVASRSKRRDSPVCLCGGWSLRLQFPAIAMIARKLTAVPRRPRQSLEACPHSQPNPDGVIERGLRGSPSDLSQVRATGSLL